MPLTLPQAAEWLVTNGYTKVDGRRSKAGSSYITSSPDEQHWSLIDWPEHGCSFLSITPASGPVEGDEDASYSALCLQLRIEGGVVVGADAAQRYSGGTIAQWKQPPQTTAELAADLEAAKKAFQIWLQALGHFDADDIAQWLRDNPGAMDFFCSPDEEEG